MLALSHGPLGSGTCVNRRAIALQTYWVLLGLLAESCHGQVGTPGCKALQGPQLSPSFSMEMHGPWACKTRG